MRNFTGTTQRAVCGVLALILQSAGAPLQEIDLASTTAWTLNGTVKPVPGGGWNAQGISSTIDNMVYQRSITIPNAGTDKVYKVLFGAVNHGAQVYIDNTLLVSRAGPMMPFEADLTGKVTPGGTHTLKVIAYSWQHYLSGGLGNVPRGWGSPTFSEGITKYVKLAVYPQVYVKDIFVRPSVTNKQLTYDLWLHNASSSARSVTVGGTLTSWNGDTWAYPSIPGKDVTLPASSVTKVTVGPIAWNLDASSYWWPNIPFRENYLAKLHYLNLTVKEGATMLDTLKQRFGFVEYTEGPYYYKVNGVRIHSQPSDGTNEDLLGWYDAYSLCPAFLPPTGPNTGCPETWKRFMRLGINTNRTHQSTPTPYMMDVADEVGFLLIPETGLRGSNDDQKYDAQLSPQACRELGQVCRNHPSVCRYSIQNEMDAVVNATQKAQLVDTMYATDPTRPQVTETMEEQGTTWAGHNGAHAWAGGHYIDYRDWPVPTNTIYLLGEYSFGGYGDFICGPSDITREADLGLDMRRRDIVYWAMWTVTLVWPNLLEGVNKAKMMLSASDLSGGTVYHNDRVDGVDGWGSEVVKWCQKALDPYVIVDKALQDANKCYAASWPTTVPTFSAGASISRALTVFNGGFLGNRMSVLWEARWGSPTGTVAASGSIDNIAVEPGFHVDKTLAFTAPSTTTTASPVAVPAGGQVMFTEDRIYYTVGGQKLYVILKSVLFGGTQATTTQTFSAARMRTSHPRAMIALSGVIGSLPGQRTLAGLDVYDLTGKRIARQAGPTSATATHRLHIVRER